jgi:hypothetical protein
VTLDVAARERAILRYLRNDANGGAPARQIYEAVTAELNDEVTLQAYYKILNRLEAAGKVEMRQGDGVGVYGLTPTLHAGNPITLDDVYQMLPFVATSEALARAVDAVDYYEEQRDTIIRKAAEALVAEDPVELFQRMILDKVALLRADMEILRHEREDDGRKEIADPVAESRMESDYKELEHVAYRGLSLPPEAIRLPGLEKIKRADVGVTCDPDRLKEALRGRVFGPTFLYELDLSADRAAPERADLVVSGSDGSMHAGVLALQSARHFIEDTSDVITFNNAIGCVRLNQRQAAQARHREMVHSAPFTRQTIDDPNYKGMVLAPFMFPDLAESEYEHMARCATDVVQFRIDAALFAGTASDLRTGAPIPKPQVHLRDGTITPQEREFTHYRRADEYGAMVREGIRLERQILDRLLTSPKPPVYGGAVKSTQMRIFGHLLNWYIAKGSAATFGAAIEPNWDLSRAAGITDNAAMTALLATLPNSPKAGRYYVSCAVLRQFPSLTEFYGLDLAGKTWLDLIEELKQDALRINDRFGGPLPYHATVDLSDDDFVFMCENADYVSFYVGHTGGTPAPMLPRYEFLTSLRQQLETGGWQAAAGVVLGNVRRITDAIDSAGVQIDRDHNFLSGKTLVKVIPACIQQAHEYAKSLGRKLEQELKSIVVSRLIEVKKVRATPADVDIRPASVRDYVERYARARSASHQPPTDDIR